IDYSKMANTFVTRTTTSNRTTRITTTSVPIWMVKLITCILCVAVLFLIYLIHPSTVHYYYKTFMFICLTVGALLGWSVGSVLQQVLTMRNVEISINFALTALSIIAAILCISYLLGTNESSSSSNFKMVVGMTACFVFQSLVCILMLSWACYGNIVVFTS
ncbi:hypothetical protein PFISCL1PPCAC_20637, partial [Pristionchus fissidentatus]